MQQVRPEQSDLPPEPQPLGLKLSYPIYSLASIHNGFEARDQDDKWSIYLRTPWIQIWRPSSDGLYCYAVRFEETGSQRIHIAESWVGSQILDTNHGFGPDLERHRKIVIGLLDFVAGFSGKRFEHRSLNGIRERNKVTFSGSAASLEDVDEIVEKLRTEVAQMMKDCC